MSESIRIQLNHLLSASEAEYVASIANRSKDEHFTAKAARERQNIHIDHLATLTKMAVATDSTEELNDLLHEHEQARELEIKTICEDRTNPLLNVVDQLAQVNARSSEIRNTVSIVGQQMDRSSAQLIEKVSRQVHMNRTRVNIEESLNIVRQCLQALEHTNQVQGLLKSNHLVAAVQSLHNLKTMELGALNQFGLSTIISQAVKALVNEITTSTLSNLSDFFNSSSLKEQIAMIGSRAYALMRSQRKAWESIVSRYRHLRRFRLNSPVELAYRRSNENFLTDSQLQVDLGPLYEAEMVFDKLGRTNELESFIESKLSRWADSLAVSNLNTILDNLQTLVGLCLFDRTLSNYLPSVRPSKMVDDNWEKLAQNISAVTGSSLAKLDDYHVLKQKLSMMIDILHNFEFNVAIINDLFRDLLKQLCAQVVKKAERDFLRHWEDGDQMQMVVTSRESYDYVMKVTWYDPQEYEYAQGVSHGEVQLPLAMPFSEIYVVVCRYLQTLLDHGHSFLDYFQHDPGFVENIILRHADRLLKNPVANTLSKVAHGQNRELIVQTLINLQLLYQASSGVENKLEKMRGDAGRRGTVALEAKPILEKATKDMETRIYVLLEETVRGFFDTSDFDWHATELAESPSTAVLEMTTYLLTMANTILKRLPPDVRLLAYFNLTENIGAGMRNALYSAPVGITPTAVDNFEVDLQFLETSVSQLSANSTPSDTLVEAKQILELLRSEDPAAEFSDPKLRNRKYGRISINHASQIIRKFRKQSESLPNSPDMSSSALSPKQSQSGFMMRYLSGDK